jgi:hypothetical protein
MYDLFIVIHFEPADELRAHPKPACVPGLFIRLVITGAGDIVLTVNAASPCGIAGIFSHRF